MAHWRESWLATQRADRLFSHILVAIDGQDSGWHALQQAIRIAKREDGHLFGVHVVKKEDDIESGNAQTIKREFAHFCQAHDVKGEIIVTGGPTADTLCYRARWADLLVVSLNHPPGPKPVDRLNSQFGQLLRRCPRPVLAVPRTSAKMAPVLLAYDGSPKASEALYVAAYMAQHWQIDLKVVVALGDKVTKETAVQVQSTLEERGVQAQYLMAKAAPAELILASARKHNCGLILMGGYGLNPMLEIAMGSVVDELLRHRNRSILICR